MSIQLVISDYIIKLGKSPVLSCVIDLTDLFFLLGIYNQYLLHFPSLILIKTLYEVEYSSPRACF